ncbi:DNA alkylation repair protein [Clostridium sp. CTA-5]
MDIICEVWTKDKYNEFISYLNEQSDKKYAEFHSKLIKGSSKLLGIRVPILRKIAKEISKGNYKEFLKFCGSEYYEEVMLEGLVIGEIKVDYNEFINFVDNFICKIDNWAICDSFCGGLKLVKKYKKEFWIHLDEYLSSENPWKKRVAIVIMLGKYLDEEYLEKVLERCNNINSNHYYVKMGIAWLVATAYCKFPQITYNYLLECSLDDWTYNKAIQKACESYRIEKSQKEDLRKMKRK